MSQLSVRLFGRLSVQCNGEAVRGPTAGKAQELFCYLLLHRDRPHPRETLASLLWGDTPTVQSKKYLRQSLWQLQGALNSQNDPADERPLRVESEWVQLNSASGLQLDVATFEDAFAAVRHVPVEDLDATRVAALRCAADLYHDDLLQGWYQDWCLYERERLQNIFLATLDKLMAYCELHGEYETGLGYGARILRYDRAREGTHQRLMRLHSLAGDRAAALRQYERCVAALREELGVPPSEHTAALYEQIRVGRLEPPAAQVAKPRGPLDAAARLPEVLGRLKELRTALADVQRQVKEDIRAVELALKPPGHVLRPR